MRAGQAWSAAGVAAADAAVDEHHDRPVGGSGYALAARGVMSVPQIDPGGSDFNRSGKP